MNYTKFRHASPAILPRPLWAKVMCAAALCLLLLVDATAQGPITTRSEASALAQKMAGGGRVLSCERTVKDEREVWRVKLVTPKGEMKVLHIDVETGNAS